MYIKKKIVPYLFILGIAAMASCTKKLNTNADNPNGLSVNTLTGKDIFPQAAAATVQNKIGSNVITNTDNYDHAPCWMGYWSRNTGWAQSGQQLQIETYTLPTSYSDGIWKSLYHNASDYSFIIGHSLPNSILTGAARVMRTMVYQDLVDQFGDVPYTQAGLVPEILTPVYDKAQAIYTDLILQLDTAITSLQASQSTSDDATDIIFKGDKNLWTKFANTLKLRILLRQIPNTSNQSYVATQLGNIVSQGSGFLGAGQDVLVNPGYIDKSQQQNPFWGVYGFQPAPTPGGPYGSPYQNNNFFCANNFSLNFLINKGDIRYTYFYGVNSQGKYGGNDFTATGPSAATTSPFGPGLLQTPTTAAQLFTASQSFFMQSEATQRGLLSSFGTYQSLYRSGVEESFRYLTVPNPIATADAYMSASNDPLVNINKATAPLTTILTQKWVAENGIDGYEAWSDFRRTGIPANTAATVPLPIPKRLLYANIEYITNLANVSAENQTSADINTKIFWGQ